MNCLKFFLLSHLFNQPSFLVDFTDNCPSLVADPRGWKTISPHRVDLLGRKIPSYFYLICNQNDTTLFSLFFNYMGIPAVFLPDRTIPLGACRTPPRVYCWNDSTHFLNRFYCKLLVIYLFILTQ